MVLDLCEDQLEKVKFLSFELFRFVGLDFEALYQFVSGKLIIYSTT